MIRNLLQIGLLGFTVVGLTPTAHPVDSKQDLTGVYRCEGEGYKGTTLIKRSGDAYQILWTIGTDTHFGVALHEGDLLSSSWTSREQIPGIVVYRIGKGKVLNGIYASYPGGKLGKETLTYLGPTQ
jgi:hypothetical protein